MAKKLKNALVTGAASRLGAEIAVALAEDGWNVAVHHNNSNPDKVLARINKTGVKTTALKADLLDINQVSKLIQRAAKELGEITLLVNSASIFEHIKFMESDENAYDSHMDIHVKAPFFLSQEFALQCHKGQIINIIDSAIQKNNGGHFVYFLSKHALRDLSQMLAKKLAPNIQVNAVLPGIVEEFATNVSPRLKESSLVSAKQLTGAIISLANSDLTGQEIFVDNGKKLI